MPFKIPPTNAELTKIESYGVIGVDDYGNEVLGWVEEWTGSASAFASEKVLRNFTESGITEQTSLEVSIPSTLADVDTGWRLSYIRGGEARTAEITSFEDRQDFGFTRTFSKLTGGTG